MDFTKAVHYSLRYENSSVSGGVRLGADSKIEHPLLSGRAIFEPGTFCIDYLMNNPEGNQTIKAFNIQKGYLEYNKFADLTSKDEVKRAKAEQGKFKLDSALQEVRDNYEEVLNQMAAGAEFSDDFLSPKQKQLFVPKQDGIGYFVITPLCAIELSRRLHQAIIDTNKSVFESRNADSSDLGEKQKLEDSQAFTNNKVAINLRPMGGKNDQNVGMFAFTAKEALTASAPERDFAVSAAFSALSEGFRFTPSKELLAKYSAFRKKLSVRNAGGKVLRSNLHNRKVEFGFIAQACRQAHLQFLEFKATLQALPAYKRQKALESSSALIRLALTELTEREQRKLLSTELAKLIHREFLNYFEIKDGKKLYALDINEEAMRALTTHAEEILLERIQCKQF